MRFQGSCFWKVISHTCGVPGNSSSTCYKGAAWLLAELPEDHVHGLYNHLHNYQSRAGTMAGQKRTAQMPQAQLQDTAEMSCTPTP